MNRIEIRGVIVPSNYDTEWMKPYIEKGIIAPESFVRNGITKADKKNQLDIYVNSPGGSVFAAYEIINAISAWKAAAKQPVTLTIGAMAASAASAIAILSGAKVLVHRNTKMMFHGAWTVSIGGKQLHEDTADLLGQINADIKTQLVSKYGIDSKLVDTWFAEGREGWINAQQAVEYGIASEIVDADDAVIEFAGADVVDIESHGMAIAAFASVGVQASDDTEEKPDADGTTDDPPSTATGDAEPETDSDPDDAEKQRAEAAIEAEVACRVELALSDRLAEHVAAINDLKAQLAAKESERASLQSQKDKAIADADKAEKQFQSQLAETRAALERANARLAKLTVGSLTFSPAIETWAEALAACNGDYANARKQYPDAYNTFMQTQKRK